MKSQFNDHMTTTFTEKLSQLATQIKDAKILDIGCGTGHYTQLFAINNNHVTGLDVQDIREKKHIKRYKFIRGSAEQLPFKNESFDVVLSFDVIEHLASDFLFVKEVKRVLKKNGRVYIATPNRHRLAVILQSLLGKSRTFPLVIHEKDLIGGIHYREYTSNELKKLFSNARFKNISIEHFWLGLRGKIDIGISYPLIKELSQILIVKNW